MSKIFSFLILFPILIQACSSSEQADENPKGEKTKVDSSGKEERVLHMVQTSELAKLMRKMDNELHTVKTCIEGGFSFHDSISFDYGKIYTAHATEAKMKKEGFDGFATAYLQQLENLKNSSPEKRKENYNMVVNGCLNCHAQHCPGPIGKIKELVIK